MTLFQQVSSPSSPAAADDDLFWRQIAFVIELQDGMGQRPVSMPLLLGPTEYSVSYQYAQSVRLSQDGGVHVYERGVSTARISLRIDPGSRPRALPTDVAKLSGHRRFREVRDKVMLFYSERKKSRASAEWSMLLHVPKDGTSWKVVPETFDLRRTSADAAGYPYSLNLIGVEQIEAAPPTIGSPNRSLLQKIGDVRQAIRAPALYARAAVDDLTAWLGQVNTELGGWARILDDVTAVLDATDDFLAGVKTTIRIPLDALQSLTRLLDRMVTMGPWGTLDVAVRQAWADLDDQITLIAAFPAAFVESSSDAAVRYNGLRAESRYTAGELADPTGTPLGTGARATDATRATAAQAEQSTDTYSSWVSVAVAETDTPEGLQNAYGTPWRVIAAVNGLRPPYFSPVFLPGTVAAGDRILVPSSVVRPLPVVQQADAALDSARDEDPCGRDVQFDDVDGFAIDDVHGRQDFALIGGADNAVQAIGVRMQTNLGDNMVFPQYGLPDVIGRPGTLERRLLVRTGIVSSLRQDPRIVAVTVAAVESAADSESVTLQVQLVDGRSVWAEGAI